MHPSRTLVAALLVGAAAAGCSSGSGGHPPPTATPTPAVTTPAGPRTLLTPVDLQPVQVAQPLTAARCPAGWSTAQDRLTCYRLGPVALHLTRVESAALTGPSLGDALQIDLLPADRARFATLTAGLVGQQLAVVIHDRVATAPVINERIDGGIQISGLPAGQTAALLHELTG